MKRTALILLMFSMMAIAACSGSNDDSADSSAQELVLNRKSAGTIETVGEVDWFHYRAVAANSILKVSCTSNTYRADVDLLITAYELDSAGHKVRIFADHAPEDSEMPADIQFNVYIDRPKDLYFAVRDLLDDEASENPYYVSIDFESGSEGNENLTEAVSITVDDTTTCQEDAISSIGDVDCFTFNVSSDGVYAVDVDFTPFTGGTDVVLGIDLFNQDGDLVQTMATRTYNYRLQSYLTAGDYYVVIDDVGRDDFDTASTYTICVESVASEEQNVNDTQSNAVDADYDATTRTYTVTGSLDYAGDVDWYHLDLSNIDTTGFKVLDISFDDDDSQIPFNYQINLTNAAGTDLWAHAFVGGSAAYSTQINSGEGDHYLSVQAVEGSTITQSLPFTAIIQVTDVDDPAETAVHTVNTTSGATAAGNDTIDAAIILIPSTNVYTTGKIGFRGDEDWYQVELDDTSQAQILEVYLDTQGNATNVEYYFSILRDSVIKKMYDDDGTVDPANLKTSVYIPAMNPATPITYYIRVADYQGDEGDCQNDYRIRANVVAVPTSLPVDASVSDPVYYSEPSELADQQATPVELAYTSLDQADFAANTTLLTADNENVVQTVSGGLTTLTFPWVGGYIDYQGDQDWFQVPLSALVAEGGTPDADWYYDIKIDMHVGGTGSTVEYIWKFYRDHNNNGALVERANDSSGFFASDGDGDCEDGSCLNVSPLDITTPSGSDEFWVGDAWEGNFYLSISDFYYLNAATPDNDWGYDTPYYFRLTLTYHPGVSRP